MQNEIFKNPEYVIDKRHLVVLPGRNHNCQLTKGEVNVVQRLLEGMRVKQIAWELNVSIHTINSHITNIKQKLDCSTMFQLGFILGWYKYHINATEGKIMFH